MPKYNTGSQRELDIMMSGDSYRIERYKQAKRQEALLEEQNRLLRENQRLMKK